MIIRAGVFRGFLVLDFFLPTCFWIRFSSVKKKHYEKAENCFHFSIISTHSNSVFTSREELTQPWLPQWSCVISTVIWPMELLTNRKGWLVSVGMCPLSFQTKFRSLGENEFFLLSWYFHRYSVGSSLWKTMDNRRTENKRNVYQSNFNWLWLHDDSQQLRMDYSLKHKKPQLKQNF